MENGFLCDGKREKEKKEEVKMENGRKYCGILGNINGSNRIISYKYNMYSLICKIAFCSNILININIVSN